MNFLESLKAARSELRRFHIYSDHAHRCQQVVKAEIILDAMLASPLPASPVAEGESQMDRNQEVRQKFIHIGAPACFALEQCCQHVCDALGGYGCYVVGSVLDRPDWRDVDVRYILDDEEFYRLFPNALTGHWEHDARWLLLTVSISGWLAKQTGLPIDFQIQPQTHANERHPGKRSAVGIRISKEAKS